MLYIDTYDGPTQSTIDKPFKAFFLNKICSIRSNGSSLTSVGYSVNTQTARIDFVLGRDNQLMGYLLIYMEAQRSTACI